MICSLSITSFCGQTAKFRSSPGHTQFLSLEGGGMVPYEDTIEEAVGRVGIEIVDSNLGGREIELRMLVCTCPGCRTQVEIEKLIHAAHCQGSCRTSSECVRLLGLDPKFYFRQHMEPKFRNANCTITAVICDNKGRKTRRSIKAKLQYVDVQDCGPNCKEVTMTFLAPYPYSFNPQIQEHVLEVVRTDIENTVWCLPICTTVAPNFETCIELPNSGFVTSFTQMHLQGPWINPVITNKVTRQSVRLNYTIGPTEIVRFDFGGLGSPATVTSNYGRNLITSETLPLDTCFTDFGLPGQCVSEICFSGSGAEVGRTKVAIWYWEWYRLFAL